jgi:glucose-6-phosphate 1-dehydrogenase
MELKENTIIVVLGASGDLAKKKTVSTRASASQQFGLTTV